MDLQVSRSKSLNVCLDTGLVSLLLAGSLAAAPQKLQLVEDIQTSGAYSTLTDSLSAELNGWVYVVRDLPETGPEVYRVPSGGGPAELVRDIQPGPAGSRPEYLTAFQGAVYFFADDGERGYELWKTDGSASGTELVLELYPGIGHGVEPPWFRRDPIPEAGGRLYFTGIDPADGRQLWSTDGTAAGTRALALPFLATPDQFPQWTTLQGDLIFVGLAYIWRLTPGGAVQLGSGYSNASGVVRAGSRVFFIAQGNGPGIDYELWLSDGTAAGTRLAGDVNPGGSSYPYFMTPFGDDLLFSADDGTHGRELWFSDGTQAGTQLVADIHPGPGASMGGNIYAPMAVFQGRAWFAADDGAGFTLWSTDGTPAGTSKVVAAGGPELVPLGGLPQAEVAGPTLFFAGRDDAGVELWRTDGTAAGTQRVTDLQPGAASSQPRSFQHDGAGGVRFLADSPAGTGLWYSDGTAAGTFALADRALTFEPQTPDADPGGLRTLPGQLLLSAQGPGTGNELWAVREGDAELVADLLPGSGSAFASGDPEINLPIPMQAVVSGPKIFFTALDGLTSKLWVSDGTPPGTVRLSGFLEPGLGDSNITQPLQAAPLGPGIVFRAQTPTYSWSVWTTDGTAEGTQLLLDTGGPASGFSAVGNRAFFFATGSGGQSQLWVTDGSPAGTRMLRTVNLGAYFGAARADLDGVLYFPGALPGQGFELWRSDGTGAGTFPVADIASGPDGSEPRNLTRVGAELYFTADDGQSGRELWRTNGLPGGTSLVVDQVPGPGAADPFGLRAVGERLFFQRDLGNTQNIYALNADVPELAASFDDDPGLGSTAAVGTRRLFFGAREGEQFSSQFGNELYSTDGSPDSAELYEDSLISGWALPNNLTLFDGRLYVSAITRTKGRELLSTFVGATAQTFGSGCSNSMRVPRLHAEDPVLGGAIAINLRDAQPMSPLVIFRGAPSAGVELGFGCRAFLDPATARTFAVAATDANGTLIAPPTGVPATPALAGAQTVLQGLVASPVATGLGFDLSNGVLLTLGD